MVYDVVLADPWRDKGTTLADATALQVHGPRRRRQPSCSCGRGGWRSCCKSLALLEAWGFDYRGHMSWQRTRQTTMTPYVREQHELVLIGRRGNPKIAGRARPPAIDDRGRGTASRRAPRHFPADPRADVPCTPSVSSCSRPAAVPRAHRDHWDMWDAPPKGDQKAA